MIASRRKDRWPILGWQDLSSQGPGIAGLLEARVCEVHSLSQDQLAKAINLGGASTWANWRDPRKNLNPSADAVTKLLDLAGIRPDSTFITKFALSEGTTPDDCITNPSARVSLFKSYCHFAWPQLQARPPSSTAEENIQSFLKQFEECVTRSDAARTKLPTHNPTHSPGTETTPRDGNLTVVSRSRLIFPDIAVVFISPSGTSSNAMQPILPWQELISRRLPHLDILSYEFASSSLTDESNTDTTSHSIRSLADDLNIKIMSATERVKKTILVSLSTGSLVVKDWLSRFSASEQGSSYLDKVYGLVFLGPIHYHSHASIYLSRIRHLIGDPLLQWTTDNECENIRTLDISVARALGRRKPSIVNLFEFEGMLGVDTAQVDSSIIIKSNPPTNAFLRVRSHTDLGKVSSPSDPQNLHLEVLIEQIEQGRGHGRIVFAHFLDHYFLKWHGYGRGGGFDQRVEREVTAALRILSLLFDRVLIPASSTFYLQSIGVLLAEFSRAFPDKILLFGEGWSLSEYAATAHKRYVPGETGYSIYTIRDLHKDLTFFGRQRSATQEVINRWLSRGPDALIAPLQGLAERGLLNRIETQWSKVPEEVGGLAFIASHILPHLVGRLDSNDSVRIATELLTADYFFESVVREFGAYLLSELPALRRPVGFLPHRGFVSFTATLRAFRASTAGNMLLDCQLGDILETLNRGDVQAFLWEIEDRLFGGN